MTIRVGTLPVAAGAQVFFAEEMGSFAKAGLDVKITLFENSGPLAVAIGLDTIDIGHVNLVSVAAHHKQRDLVVIAPAGQYSSQAPTTALVLAPNSTAKQASDLNGKKIGTQGHNTINAHSVLAWMDQNGGDASSVTLVDIRFSDMLGALKAGSIDAAVLTEPYLDLAKKQNLRVLGFPFDAIAQEFPVNGWATTPQWAKDHPDQVKAFAAVMRDTANWANQNRDKSSQILAKYLGLAQPGLTVRYAVALTPAMIQPQIDKLAKYAKFAPFPAAELVVGGPA